MKASIKLILWGLGVVTTVFLMAFEKISENKTLINDIQIEIEQENNQLFLNKEDIISALEKQEDSLLLKSINSINTSLLEESLKNHPFVAQAEVFSTLDGLLSVQVKQKIALARILDMNEHYYIDAKGHPFPCSKTYSARVPVFTGKLDSTGIAQAFSIMQTVATTTYFKNWLAEIHIKPNYEFELIPIKANHRVLFGDTTNAHKKLRKLEAFYKTAVTEENLNEWKSLNVAYDNLLVTTKH